MNEAPAQESNRSEKEKPTCTLLRELLQWLAPQHVQNEQQQGSAQDQWQARRTPPQAVPAPTSPPAQENLKLLKITGEDIEACLPSFEQVTEACQRLKGQWTAPLLPCLNGKAQQPIAAWLPERQMTMIR